MQLAEIVSVTGLPGIYQVKGKRADGLIVMSLTDGKSQFVSGRVHMFSTLDNITMYTTDEPRALKEILAEMKKQEAKHKPVSADAKEDEIRAYIEKIIPDYDKEKVYLSDMKKLIRWYNILNEKGLIEELTAEETAEAQTDAASATVSETAAEETAKTATTKTAKKAEKTTAKEAKPKAEKVAKPAKVAAPKTSGAPKKITTPRKAS